MTGLRDLLRLAGQAPEDKRRAILAELAAAHVRSLADDWDGQALPAQVAPAGNWRTWLIMAGRGFGKTRTGAEWVLRQARHVPGARIALIGASIEEAARVMVEGESGLIACARPDDKVGWRRSQAEVRLPKGGIGQLYSGASPAGLRGPQHHFAWADEIAKWQHPDESWDMLQMGLRLGQLPRSLVTTTPASIPLLKRLLAAPGVALTRGTTFDNPHLPAAFVEAVRQAYGNSRLGRQELNGEYIEEAAGALWTRDIIERCRTEMPAREALVRVVVGVDPPAGDKGDACGIVVCGQLRDGRGVVLADCSAERLRPDGWARAAARAAEAWDADRVVAECNNGGLMVEDVLRAVAPGLPIRLVRASRGKVARAEPVAAAFEAGRCLIAGCFPELEDELTAMTAEGFAGSGSPDRADALVWALSALVVKPVAEPRLRRL